MTGQAPAQLSDFVAVKQASFIAKYEPLWHQFDALCLRLNVTPATTIRQGDDRRNDRLVSAKFTAKSTHQPTHNLAQMEEEALRYQLAMLYRQICQHYALACQRNYSPLLTQSLHERVMIGHRLIHQSKSGYLSRFVQFVLIGFPNAVRQHARLFWLGFVLFYLPFFVMLIACYLNDNLIYSVMDSTQVAMMEEMYNPANEHIGREASRASDTDMMMFGHYINNNIGIDFKVYAMGIFFGIGTVFLTLYNGVIIGAVAGHLTGRGFSETFWSFVSGHGSFELTAIVISAAAGLRLATPLIAPAPYRRRDAFVMAGKESIQLLLGAALMTFIAAFIEAFWSSSTLIPNGVKYAVAAGLWLFVGWYLLFCGKLKTAVGQGE